MTRQIGLLLLLLLLLAGCGRSRPNVLLVTIDTLRADRLGSYGAVDVLTPHMDRIAREGALFAECTTPIPETAPAHATILTGLYPRHHGIRENGIVLRSGNSLAVRFSEAGYETAGFVSGFPLIEKFGFARGFDHFDDYLTDGFTGSGTSVQGTERTAAKTIDAALRWLAGRKAPWFVWIHLFDPHAPYAAPGPERRLYYAGDERSSANRSMDDIRLPANLLLGGVTDIAYPVALYEGEVSYTDRQIGRLVRALETEGAWRNTITALLADHGESLTEHQYYFGHSRFLYDPSVHVPLLVRAPASNALPRGVIVREEVSLLDVAPTLAVLAGLAGEDADGVSLEGALRGESIAPRPLYLERSPHEGPLFGIRQGGWKLLASRERGRELYHLETDPGERVNLAGDTEIFTREGGRLASILERWAASDTPVDESAIDEETKRVLRGLGYVR